MGREREEGGRDSGEGGQDRLMGRSVPRLSLFPGT